MPNETTVPYTWSDWDAESHGLECEASVGLTIADDDFAFSKVSRWLSWDETVALHRWLSEKIEEHLNGHPSNHQEAAARG